ncbi:COBRA-like protein 7 [Carex littledalei]|uniref:COBRA-like protein 7 n=1 Tax=Carex littledalei TaxID=544730 RepID=A0A833QEP5_9POAL|nr:COBRA-like protein 7 [Carex littledalei]
MEASSKLFLLLFLSTLALLTTPSFSQTTPADASLAPAPAPDPGCNGVELTYDLWGGATKIRPFVTDPTQQAYTFQARATVLNSGTTTLKSWSILIKFKYKEIIVTLKDAVLTNGADLPYNTTLDANATSFSGSTNTDLLTPIATANDLSLIQGTVDMVGTLFGAPKTLNPFPESISLEDPSYICPPFAKPGNYTFSVKMCCVPNPKFNPNNTVISNITDPKKDYKDPPTGDLIITYDVIQAYPSSYLALVTIENFARLGRLDNWHLSWTWKNNEFINSMRGAYPLDVDATGCIYGPQAAYYQNLDFSTVLNCQRSPVILDLPLSHYNNTQLGKIDNCCRNGTILPKAMDPAQTKSSFQMQVFKMPPDLNITTISPPTKFKIAGGSPLNPDYTCNPAVRVAPTEFPDPSGLESHKSGFATWKIGCNITVNANTKPKCCVTFSGFYNDSVLPCSTCACGCPANRAGPTCSTTTPAMLLPPEALLVPFDNRTAKTQAWASLKHLPLPNPMPCGDYCGVSINWHIATDYNKGWSARITLFNWGQVNFADWFAAIVMDDAYDGYEKMYSFNGSAVGNNTIFMQGLEGLNYLVKMSNGSTSSDPMVPGKQQTVVSFTKKTTPGINIISGGGFPSKVYFNGDECSLPTMFPQSAGFRNVVGPARQAVFALLVSLVMILGL